jgi:hypothetical protein
MPDAMHTYVTLKANNAFQPHKHGEYYATSSVEVSSNQAEACSAILENPL